MTEPKPEDLSGDMGAFEHVLHETQDVVRAYIAGMGVALYEVDDVAQEVYLAFYKGMADMPKDVEPIRWLKGIARRLSKNHFRKMKWERARRHDAIAELLAEAEEDSADEALFACSIEVLRRCLEGLSEKNRQMMTMKYEENLNSTAIAKAIRMKAGAVRMTLLRLREIVRECVSHNMKGWVGDGP